MLEYIKFQSLKTYHFKSSNISVCRYHMIIFDSNINYLPSLKMISLQKYWSTNDMVFRKLLKTAYSYDCILHYLFRYRYTYIFSVCFVQPTFNSQTVLLRGYIFDYFSITYMHIQSGSRRKQNKLVV